MAKKKEMVDRRSWAEFSDSGLFWFVNSLLHAFGWAIVVEIDRENGEFIAAYPARVRFRGFDEQTMSEGYIKVAQYMKDNAPDILDESKE